MSDISLEIHHLDVRGGDATAIIVRDMEQEVETGGKQIYRVLIDAGAEKDGSSALKFYLEKYLPGVFDLIVATHFHQDHIEGFFDANIRFKTFLDNGGYKDGYDNFVEPRNGLGKNAETTTFGSYKGQVQMALPQDPSVAGKTKFPQRVSIPFIEKGFAGDAAPVVIELGTGSGITLTCHCANGILADGKDVLGKQYGNRKKAISPNDTSLGLLLKWDDFTYLTMGDLSGDVYQSDYYDIERKFVDYLAAGPLNGKTLSVYKASHHGSEHSSQDYLFTKLKPDTTVVCCNIMKQVPSPIFLQRLKTYFATAPRATAVFANTMKVFKSDDRYAGLLGIKDFLAAGNFEFATAGDESYSSNLGVKCVVVRRRVRNGTLVLGGNRPVSKSKLIVKFGAGFEIVLMDRPEDDQNQVSATIKFSSFQMLKRWATGLCGLDDVTAGFNSLAAAIVKWLATDDTEKETVGIDYITEHYPALVKTIVSSPDASRQAALVTRMLSMFNLSFTLIKGYWEPQPSAVNTLSSDEKKTIFRILRDNSHQIRHNWALEGRYERGTLKPQFAWNVKYCPEPYTTDARNKRKRENDPPDLEEQAKRSKPDIDEG